MGLCGYNLTNTEPIEAVTSRTYRGDGTKRAVLWCHGHGQAGEASAYVDTWKNPNGEYFALRALAETAGLPVVIGQFASDNWGNDAGQAKMSDARTWAASGLLTAKTDKVILAAVSMGGLTALNWARANPSLVAAVLLFYPVVNLVAAHDATGGSTSFQTSIETAYTNLAGYNAAKATHDPAQNAASYTGVPIEMWYSTADATVGTANQTAFATAVGGSNFTSRSLGPVAHSDMTQIDPAEVASFAAAHA